MSHHNVPIAGAANHTIEWPLLLPREKPVLHAKWRWRIASRIVVPAVGVLSKLCTDYFNKTTIYNHDVLMNGLAKHHKNRSKNAFVTLCNHSSCLDDPLIWGSLIPFKWHLNSSRLRWSAAAQEICFTKDWHSTFFALGKTFPIVRGKGIYQPAMDFALELLKDGQWLHFFPEGKVIINPDTDKFIDNDARVLTDSSVVNQNSDKKYELKWGIARLILDHVLSNETSGVVEVLPFYHCGMNDVIPNTKPYIPRVNKKVTFYIRDDGPLCINANYLYETIKNFASLNTKEKRIKLMQIFEHEMNLLKHKAMKVHNNFNVVS